MRHEVRCSEVGWFLFKLPPHAHRAQPLGTPMVLGVRQRLRHLFDPMSDVTHLPFVFCFLSRLLLYSRQLPSSNAFFGLPYPHSSKTSRSPLNLAFSFAAVNLQTSTFIVVRILSLFECLCLRHCGHLLT